MKIGMIALGSRGDVQPYIALGRRFVQTGAEVRIVSHPDYAQLIRSYGLDFWPTEGNVQELVQSAEVRKLLAKGNFLAIAKFTGEASRRVSVQWAQDGLAALDGVDFLMAGMGGIFIGIGLAEKLQIPLVPSYLVPFTPTGAFPGPLVPGAMGRMGRPLNRLSHHLTQQMMWQSLRSGDGLMRRQILGLDSAPFFGPFASDSLAGSPVLYGFSPSVIPKPDDWGQAIHVTGYWFLDAQEQWTPPTDLRHFLEAGPPPVYVGFGSMTGEDPEQMARLVVEGILQAGQRAVLLSGWGGMAQMDLPENIHMLEAAPHDWLFPRMAAVVHHGGAGTTAAGLRAGVPSIIVPFFGDQPFWGRRVKEMGVGPEAIPRKKLTAQGLAQALHTAVTDSSIRQKAAALGQSIQAEDGVGEAVAIITRHFGQTGPQPSPPRPQSLDRSA
jgi:UDP:flavonoid glycosyltransferase YjiC (YdhE family)